MTGRHEAPPVGSAAREATAGPYAGRHRAVDLADDTAVCNRCGFPAVLTPLGWAHADIADAAFCSLVMRGET